MIIFLDLDGVIINFAKGVCDWFDIPYTPEKITHWDSLYTLTETKGEVFWNNIKSPNFWENLEFYPEAKSFIKKLNKYYKVVLLTSPADGCAGYRQNWIENNLPEFFKNDRYILSPAKWACAHKNAVLIDDSEKNYREFNQNNGRALLYPQPWNSGKGLFASEKEKNYVTIELLSFIIF